MDDEFLFGAAAGAGKDDALNALLLRRLRARIEAAKHDGEPMTYAGHPLDPERPQLGDPVRDAPLALVDKLEGG